MVCVQRNSKMLCFTLLCSDAGYYMPDNSEPPGTSTSLPAKYGTCLPCPVRLGGRQLT